MSVRFLSHKFHVYNSCSKLFFGKDSNWFLTKIIGNVNKHSPIYPQMVLSIMKILLIDDDKQITSMLSKFFNFEGHTTVITNDPMEGLQHIQQEYYDVILLDISMPKFNGLNIIKILETNQVLKYQNIFIFSGADFNENQIKDLLMRDGVNGFLKKPMELDELLTSITC